MNESALLEELIRAEAPAHMLLQEGFTPQEIRAAKVSVSLDSARAETVAPLQTETQ